MPSLDSPSLTTVVARGATADLYAYTPGRVLKFFHAGCSRGTIEEEARKARAVSEALARWRASDGHAALRVPGVGEVVAAEGRCGIVYERIEGPSMLEVLWTQPASTVPLARLLAELQARLHTLGPAFGQTAAVPLSQLPRKRERLGHQIQQTDLSIPRRDAALQALASLCAEDEPHGLCLCHGDFHPGNVLLTTVDGDGENAVVIDWCDVTLGSPYADVARTLVLLQAVEDAAPDPAIVARAAEFRDTYRVRYLELAPERPEHIEQQIQRWLPVVAAGRLSENIPAAERERLNGMTR